MPALRFPLLQSCRYALFRSRVEVREGRARPAFRAIASDMMLGRIVRRFWKERAAPKKDNVNAEAHTRNW
jgi:hypothetical protein